MLMMTLFILLFLSGFFSSIFVNVNLCCFLSSYRTAYDVSLTDNSWPLDAFDIVSGNTSKSWERLDA